MFRIDRYFDSIIVIARNISYHKYIVQNGILYYLEPFQKQLEILS